MSTEFNEANMKIMATALFFEYTVYAVFNIYDTVKKDHPEYVFLSDEAKALAEQNQPPKMSKEEKQRKKEEEKKKKDDLKKKKAKDKKKKSENVKESDEQYDGGDSDASG